ncbi:hypothetical protein [Brachybacterium sp. YJGR34]|uniref:hypothetical protein n=1 Tax=Brachybacterium sp. YJGR34 TaxID=2059911 RepID=UPI000E0CAAF8|nr:hypothetical protein [Brachybacterium sp. YJGR34]
MTEPDTTPRRGRRARTLSPEESAALEARAAVEATGEQDRVPGVRGAVAPPTAEDPVPTLRKFGRRARIIELSEESSSTVPDERTAPDIQRDHDGVELGELSVTEAPDPRPAPRFDGKVLHRPERSGGLPLVWLVWALIAIAIVVLVILLLTGVIGPAEASALDAAVHDPSLIHLVLEEPAA